MVHVQHDYFSLFKQLNRLFAVMSVVAVTVVRHFLNPLKYLAQWKQPTKTLRNVVIAENFSLRSYKSERVRVSHAMKASLFFPISE